VSELDGYDKRNKCVLSVHLNKFTDVASLTLLGANSSKMPKAPLFQNRSGWNFTGLFFKQIHIDWRSQVCDL